MLLAFAAVGCHRKDVPDGIVPQEKMVDFLADAYLLEASYALESGYKYDTLPASAMEAYDSLLAVHGVSRDEMNRSIEYYSMRPETYAAINDSALARIPLPRI